MNWINRKTCLKWLKPIFLVLIGAIVGSGGLVLYFCFSNTTIKATNEYDPWLISYYLFQIIGAIGTMMAVVVALSKEAIMKWLYSPSLEISLVDNGVTENIPDTQKVPVATSFECLACIDNKGSLAALGCRVYVSDIKHGKNKANVKSIKNLKSKQLQWTSSGVDVPIGIPSKIRLFEVINPNSIGTPGENSSEKPRILFNGLELKNNQSEKGYWIIEYYISCRNGKVSKFSLNVEWNGEFKSRTTDMEEVLNVEINRK
ncbi:hypothetical protein [Bacteroides ovatus]|uniref:Uncharacterized protein n=1 Tax=Bacteroides ovatus TaxID=28116 RepID=A0A413EW96_BACOV|nr:hypothetical protein [Bacteroides ovatus]RGX12135.1 hypothetical protein DWV35_05370 [Bacteroides ovatus]RGX27509.1 hypothetical protein DWV30_02725 [Bacteroides ovatus]